MARPKIYTEEEKKAKKRAYYQANKEALKIKMKAWRESNKEAISIQKKAYYKDNKESIDIYRKAYNDANQDKRKAYREANIDKSKAWYESHRLTHHIVYCLPYYDKHGYMAYAGVTDIPYNRMNQHNHGGNSTEDWFILQVCETREEAEKIESEYHKKGYAGGQHLKINKK